LIGVAVLAQLDRSPMVALVGVAVGTVGGIAGYLELRRRTAR